MSDYISFDRTDYLKSIKVLGINYQHYTRRIYISFEGKDAKPIIFDVWGEDINKTVEGFKKEVKGTMNYKNQEEFIKCISDNWYKIIDFMNKLHDNADQDVDSANAATPGQQAPITPLNKAELAVSVAQDKASKLFIDEYKEPHALIKVSDHLEVFPLNSRRFKTWLSGVLYKEENEVIDGNTLSNAIGVLNAKAIFDSGDPIKLNLRVAQNSQPSGSIGNIIWYYDLTNNNWEFLQITSEGWDVVNSNDLILFRRYDNNQSAQVYPSKEYQPDIFDRFMKLVNIKANDEHTKLLLKCYIVSLFIPNIQKPVLMLHGSQGAAKSSLEEIIKMLVDPSVMKTRSFPRFNELIQQLSHNHINYYDNISSIPPWISDEFCRAVTGSGSSKRQLFTDDDDFIRVFTSCIGFNGVNLGATRADLLDRGIIIKLERISKKQQRKPSDIQMEFDDLKPQLLGYIFDILAKVLDWKNNGNGPKLNLTELPRMAEFAEYGEVISRLMGYPENEFINVYNENRELQNQQVIESDEIATCIREFAIINKNWGGTPTELYNLMEDVAESLKINIKSKHWPKGANQFTRRMHLVIPTLKETGIEIEEFQDDHKRRQIVIHKTSSEPSGPSEAEIQARKQAKISDDVSDDVDGYNKTPSENSEEITLKNTNSDDVDDADDVLRTIKCQECDHETEPFSMKIHYQSTGHGEYKEPEIREVKEASGVTTQILDKNNSSSNELNIADFIKIQGTQDGDDKTTFSTDPAIGELLLQNNFLTGHLRMRGKEGGAYPYNYLEFIDNVFGRELNTIEVCSRTVKDCFTVDINPENKPDLVVDGQTLDGIKDSSFSRWRCDPPYNEKTAKEMYNCELPSLSKLLQAGARVVKPGSLMFLLCSQNYQFSKNGLKRIGFVYISVVPNNETRILNIYVKLESNL